MNYNTTIKKIRYEQAESIIDTRQPRGLFYTILGGLYVGIDNDSGQAWTETFPTLRKCKQWLSKPYIEIE